MIFDTIGHCAQYRDSYPAVYRALKAMQKYSSSNYSTGKVELDGNNLFLLLNQYLTHTSEGALAEAHKKYLDVMYMEESEALLAKTDADVSAIRLQAGDFLVLFPQDAHTPACYGSEGAMEVKKIIAKVRIC